MVTQGDFVLLDIGASAGTGLEKWDQFLDSICRVMIEPDPHAYRELKKQMRQHDRVINCALWSEDATLNLNVTQKRMCSSLYKPNLDFLGLFPDAARWSIEDQVVVNCTTLDSLDLDKVDFIKIDTQGSELDILKGGPNLLSTCLGVEVEVEFSEIYCGQPLFGDICSWLSAQGFQFYDFVVEYRYNRKKLDRTGQLVFADALFLRPPEYIKLNFPQSRLNSFELIAKVYSKLDLLD